MFERQRTEPEPDIEFDFFDESPTREVSREEAAQPGRRRMPRRPSGSGGGQGIFRLVVLIGAALLLAVILVLWINSCRAGQKRDAYQSYMEQVGAVAGESTQIGQELNTLVTTPGITLEDLQSGIEGLRRQQEQTVGRASQLEPPGPLREEQQSLVEALQFRVSGLAGLAQGFAQLQRSDAPEEAGETLALQANRLLASDVVYDDLFRAKAQETLQQEEISGVAVPGSDFVQGFDLAGRASWTQIVERLTQAPEAGGPRGNQINAVRVQPGGEQLSPTETTTVPLSDRLSLQVVVENSGEVQLTQIPVTLTIQQSPEPVRQEKMIDIINPGQTKTVAFDGLGFLTPGAITPVQVAVEPVAGETNTNNNTAEYRVIFSVE